ncbi:MAG: SDR family oxidoreductase [Candidatus Bathyarchaeia archaeon]
MEKNILLRWLHTREDIGNITVFLALEEARNITGQSMNVNGGSVELAYDSPAQTHSHKKSSQ